MKSLSKGFTVLSLAGVINKVLGVLYVPVLTLFLGNVGNGIYNAGYTIYILVFVITNAGIPVAISKLISEQIASAQYEASYRTFRISGSILISLGVLTSILTAVFAKPLSSFAGWPDAYLTILALSPTMFFTAVSCTFRGYFQGRSDMMPTSISQIIEQAVNTTLTILFAWIMLEYGKNHAMALGLTNAEDIRLEAVKYAAAGGTVGTSAGALASAFYLVRTFLKNKAGILDELKQSISDRLDKTIYNEQFQYTTKKILRKIYEYSVPITFGSVAIYITSLIDLKFTKERLIAGGFSVTEASGLYGIFSTQYLKVIFIPITIATALATAIIPAISAAAAKKDKVQLGRTISKSMKIILMLSVPAAVGIGVMAKPIVNILFPTAPDGWELLMMGSWVLVLISVVSIQTAILQGIGKTYVPTMHLVVGLGLKLFVNYNLISIKGINIKGAIAGSAACYIFAGFMNYLSIRKYTRVRLNYRQLFNRPLSVSIIMGLAVLAVYEILKLASGFIINSVFLQSILCGGAAIAAGGIAYYLVMIIARGIAIEDIRSFPMGGRILALTLRIPLMRKYLSR